MVRIGILINVIGITVITLLFYFLGTAVFGIDVATLPSWAE